MNATNPVEQLTAIADEISANKVDIVGLEEASIWRTGPSSLTGPATPAENVTFDYVAILLDRCGHWARTMWRWRFCQGWTFSCQARSDSMCA